jgi:hypothetical protein
MNQKMRHPRQGQIAKSASSSAGPQIVNRGRGGDSSGYSLILTDGEQNVAGQRICMIS